MSEKLLNFSFVGKNCETGINILALVNFRLRLKVGSLLYHPVHHDVSKKRAREISIPKSVQNSFHQIVKSFFSNPV